MAKARRRRAGRPRNLSAQRKPSGQIRYETTLPPPEVIARRGEAWQDQDSGDVFGVMRLRGLLPDHSARRDADNKPGPTPLELKVAGQSHAALVADYERMIDAPVCEVPSHGGGRTLSADDAERYARTRAKMLAARSVLRRLDHGCTIALARAVAAVTAEQIEVALRWVGAIVPALVALHEAGDEIARAGRFAAEAARVKEAA